MATRYLTRDLLKLTRLEHRFVTEAPSVLQPGVLYVSLDYVTTLHLCCCGCGQEAITPLSPQDWRLTYDGETVSLWPSIGNWSFPCKSHYWIKEGRVVWAPQWTDDEIAFGRSAESRRRALEPNPHEEPAASAVATRPWWRRLF